MKGLTRRPLIIKLAAAYFAVAPLFYVSLHSFFASGNPFSEWGQVVNYTLPSLIILCLSWVAAFAVWKVNAWGWYFVLVYCAASIAHNLSVQLTGGVFPNWAIVGGQVFAFGGLLLFLNREVRSPYLNPRICWWKTSPRYRVAFGVEITPHGAESENVELLDISKTGCFTTIFTDAEVPRDISIRIQELGYDISAHGVVVRIGNNRRRNGDDVEGVGIKFTKLEGNSRSQLRAFLKELGDQHPSREEADAPQQVAASGS